MLFAQGFAVGGNDDFVVAAVEQLPQASAVVHSQRDGSRRDQRQSGDERQLDEPDADKPGHSTGRWTKPEPHSGQGADHNAKPQQHVSDETHGHAYAPLSMPVSAPIRYHNRNSIL